MLFWIFLILILILAIFIISKKGKTNRNSSYVDKTYPPVSKPQRIEDCVSTEDIQYQISSETQRIIDTVEESKEVIKSAMTAANREINTAWLNSYEKLLKYQLIWMKILGIMLKIIWYNQSFSITQVCISVL